MLIIFPAIIFMGFCPQCKTLV